MYITLPFDEKADFVIRTKPNGHKEVVLYCSLEDLDKALICYNRRVAYFDKEKNIYDIEFENKAK